MQLAILKPQGEFPTELADSAQLKETCAIAANSFTRNNFLRLQEGIPVFNGRPYRLVQKTASLARESMQKTEGRTQKK